MIAMIEIDDTAPPAARARKPRPYIPRSGAQVIPRQPYRISTGTISLCWSGALATEKLHEAGSASTLPAMSRTPSILAV
jgi:hypothetical protein